jgi:hypothetical protein
MRQLKKRPAPRGETEPAAVNPGGGGSRDTTGLAKSRDASSTSNLTSSPSVNQLARLRCTQAGDCRLWIKCHGLACASLAISDPARAYSAARAGKNRRGRHLADAIGDRSYRDVEPEPTARSTRTNLRIRSSRISVQ